MKLCVLELGCGGFACMSLGGNMFAPAREHFVVASASISLCEKRWLTLEDGVRALMGNICRAPVFPDAEKYLGTAQERNAFYKVMHLGLRVPQAWSGVPLPTASLMALGEVFFAEPPFDRAGIFLARNGVSMLLVGKRTELSHASWTLVDLRLGHHYATCITSAHALVERHIERLSALLSGTRQVTAA